MQEFSHDNDKAVQHYTKQLQKLAQAAILINSTFKLEKILDVIIEQARHIVGAHQAAGSIVTDNNWEHAIDSVSLSEKYQQYEHFKAKPNGTGIYALVCQTNQPVRLTQIELEQHSQWHQFSDYEDQHPPLDGWLAAPLTSRSGANMGVVQLSDKYDGQFTKEDEGILIQLTQLASAAIENVHLQQQMQEVVGLNEHQRLTSDLQDAISQKLFSASVIAEALPLLLDRNPERISGHLRQLATLSRSALIEMRSLLLELSPDMINKKSLDLLLNQLVEAAKGRKLIETTFYTNIKKLTVQPHVHLAFYRVAQETISYVLTYSGASQLEVMLSQHRKFLRLRISHNGQGFSAQSVDADKSLTRIRRYAEAIGGELKITTRRGIHITLTWKY